MTSRLFQFRSVAGKNCFSSAAGHRLLLYAGVLLVAGCSPVQLATPRQANTALEEYRATELGRTFAGSEKAHSGKSGYKLLSDNIDSLVARLALVDAAEQTVDLQYYIYRFDVAGQMLSKKLLAAADRGIRVRLLLDDLEIEDTEDRFAVLDSHPNIQVRLFNPFAGRSGIGRLWSLLVDFKRINQRMHNKVFAVDNQVAIVGGRNIADPYFTQEATSYFSDLDLLASGPIVREISSSFDLYWNSELSVPVQRLVRCAPSSAALSSLRRQLFQQWQEHRSHVYRQRLRTSSLKNSFTDSSLKLVWAPGEVVYDRPQQILKDEHGADSLTLVGASLRPYFEGISSEFLLISPYLIPGHKGMSLFRTLRESNISISILTNSLAASDIAAVYGAYADYRRQLLEMGIQLYELKPSSRVAIEDRDAPASMGAILHAKTMLFDKTKVFIGSMNLDPRSIYLNTELGLIIDSRELNTQIRELFSRMTSLRSSFNVELTADHELIWRTLEEDRLTIYRRSPGVSFWRILWADLAELLIPNRLL